MHTKLEITVDGEIQDFLGANMGRQVTEYTNHTNLTQNKGHFTGIILYSTTGFAWSQNKVDALKRVTVWSRHGYIIHYAGCPTIWKS